MVEGFLGVASRMWGEEEARILRPAIERVAKAVRKVEGFELDPVDEPWKPPGEA